ncbi:sugar phosphate isomerase/epimerase family protein [Mycolicibacterium baixiangningiae]|uniref:sugar phosphate isomerase/epimerase family protein n=1 Tax=Mycolicibacterium baixiangningiae TaxID=2761578 RepID=UPI001E3F6507|nr:sugar phosphate isomerase/epimerase family protein [Mycolicibacterium baixiangningiae]
MSDAMAARPISYVAADVDGMEPRQLVEVLADAGYAGVDWTMEQFDPLQESPGALQALVDIANQSGLTCPQLLIHQDFVTSDPSLWDERVRRTERALEAAADAGIPTAGVVTGPNRWAPGWEEPGAALSETACWDLALAALDRALTVAERVGVTLCLEPCWGTLASDRYRAEYVLGRVGDELGVTVDPSHFVMTGDDVPAMIRSWSARVSHVHLKDAFGAPGMDGEDFCFLLPGEGRADWPGIFAALDSIDYAGAMAVEFESFALRRGPLRGDIAAGARLARRLVDGLLGTGTGL